MALKRHAHVVTQQAQLKIAGLIFIHSPFCFFLHYFSLLPVNQPAHTMSPDSAYDHIHVS